MELKTGDKVKFLNSVGGGIVTKIVDKKLVEVLTEDEFEIPVLKDELVKIEDSEDDFLQSAVGSRPGKKQKENQLPKQEDNKEEEEEDFLGSVDDEIFEKNDDDISIFIAFVPKNRKNVLNSDFDLFLINDSNYFLMYNILVPTENDLYKSYNGTLEPNIKFELFPVMRDEISAVCNLSVQFLFFKKKSYQKMPPIHKDLKLKSSKFYKLKTFKENDFFHQLAYLYPVVEQKIMEESLKKLNEEDIKKVIIEKEIKSKQFNAKVVSKSSKPKLEEVVDLHIHELVDNEKGLSNKEMLDIQMTHFRNSINKAIEARKVRRVIFIHGIGNGVLRQEIRNELSRKYSKYQHQDASFKEYGYGATMVLLNSPKK